MTYKKFLNIAYNTAKEKDYYCWATAGPRKVKDEDKEKYEYYKTKIKKIADFKKEVLIKALKNLPDNYFD